MTEVVIVDASAAPARGGPTAIAVAAQEMEGTRVVARSPGWRPRLRRAALPLALVVLLCCDLARPPARQVSARLLLGGIHLYQATLSPRMPGLGVHCRFTPTCSHYAVGAIERHGALFGSLRAVWRICRCGPWTRLGTYDPPT